MLSYNSIKDNCVHQRLYKGTEYETSRAFALTVDIVDVNNIYWVYNSIISFIKFEYIPSTEYGGRYVVSTKTRADAMNYLCGALNLTREATEHVMGLIPLFDRSMMNCLTVYDIESIMSEVDKLNAMLEEAYAEGLYAEYNLDIELDIKPTGLVDTQGHEIFTKDVVYDLVSQDYKNVYIDEDELFIRTRGNTFDGYSSGTPIDNFAMDSMLVIGQYEYDYERHRHIELALVPEQYYLSQEGV